MLGSVFTGSYCGVVSSLSNFHAHHGDFVPFEAKIRDLLSQGLVARMRRNLFTRLGLKVVGAFVVVGAVAIVVALIRWVLTRLRGFALEIADFEIFCRAK